MLQKKRVAIVTQAMDPYVIGSSIAKIAGQLPKVLQKKKMEIRIFMPRFGTINERRHKLHEVVRLSGINIIIDEDDFPLIIKVASMPETRLQVYFLDNEDFFSRKFIHTDADENFFEDNTERMIFFCKGVLETVKKMGWAPDIMHCHGWMTSLIPLYLKTAYKSDPLFNHLQVIYSVYQNSFEASLGDIFAQKAKLKKVEEADMAPFMSLDNPGLDRGGIHYADALIKGDEELHESVQAALATADKPILDHSTEEAYLDAYTAFFAQLLTQEEEEEA